MQYRNYEIQHTSDGCIIRKSTGEYIIKVPTETEAEEYIDDLEETQKPVIDWNYKFELYTHDLPGRCFIDKKVATTNKDALLRFVKPFENLNNVHVNIYTDFRGGEYFYIVDTIDEVR